MQNRLNTTLNLEKILIHKNKIIFILVSIFSIQLLYFVIKYKVIGSISHEKKYAVGIVISEKIANIIIGITFKSKFENFSTIRLMSDKNKKIE